MGAIPADAANLNPDTHGFSGIQQGSYPVVGESSEPEGGASDAFAEIVGRFGGAVADPSLMPVGDLVMPTPQRVAQPGQFRWAVRVGEILRELTQIAVS